MFSADLIARLRNARRVAVLTGAGMSAESGVPTFRDPDGLWARFKPEELASMDAFLANPELVQDWYAHRREIVQNAAPNPGHLALVELEGRIAEFTLVTQNVDNLHTEAGSTKVLELHGNLTRNYCLDCRRPAADGGRCGCGGLIRPDVVWFGEMLPDGVFEAAHQAAVRAEVFLSIGTSAVVYPAAGLPLAAADAGAYTVELNVEHSAIAHAMQEVVLGPSGETLPTLVRAVFGG
ncbi:MAG: NAD-dependent deacylase [Rhodothermales bacterium]|nr:NAD-dependent deacylase [Rhodothermales bacterium]MBO6780040.1 NAD-dependent deacylase [Rhodothermales bacterium]